MRFRLYRNKSDISINEGDDEDTIDYKQFSYYDFDSDASAPLKDTDEITMLNVPLQVSGEFDDASEGVKLLTFCF